jgi:hypothetical protein
VPLLFVAGAYAVIVFGLIWVALGALLVADAPGRGARTASC